MSDGGLHRIWMCWGTGRDAGCVQPIAARSDDIAYDRLHHFIGAGLWESAPLEATLWSQANELLGGDKAWLIIDDTALPKKGKASVGVAPQYATALGKNANCQTLVSITLASGEVPLMLSLRLFLPESWTSDTSRMEKAGVPAAFQEYRTKPEIAIDEMTVLSLPKCASAACWQMLVTGCPLRSGRR